MWTSIFATTLNVREGCYFTAWEEIYTHVDNCRGHKLALYPLGRTASTVIAIATGNGLQLYSYQAWGLE